MLRQFFKEFSADRRRKVFTFSVRAGFAALFCFLLFSCGGSNDTSADGKAQKAAGYFARSFSLFIPDGYTVGVEGYSPGGAGGFHGGRFVLQPPEGERGEIPPIPFLLTPDGNHLLLGTAGPFDLDDFDDSGVAGFKAVPDSVRSAPSVLASKNGRIISADRIMDIRVDYAKRNMDRISLAGAPVLGSEDAKVTVVEYSDFQCPFCRDAARYVQDLLREYDGRVKLVYKQLPLPFHDWAYQASEASLCFHSQGGNRAFGYFHDEVFANQKEITKENHRERFSLIAEGAELSPREILACMDSGEMKKRVERDLGEAYELKADGTPTFFVDGMAVPNDFDLLKKALKLRFSPES